METLADFRDRFLNDPLDCSNCGTQMKFINEGTIYSKKKPHLPIKFILLFQCPNCKMLTAPIFCIRRIDLRGFSQVFLLTKNRI